MIADAYCLGIGVAHLVRRHAVTILVGINCFALGAIAWWWYVQ